MVEIGFLIPIVMVLTEIIKRKTNIDDKLCGIVALVLGIALNVLNAFIFGGDLRMAGLDGFIAAFIASGAFSIGKNVGQYTSTKQDK